MKKLKAFLLYIVISSIIIFISCGFPNDIPHKSDEMMIKNLRANKAGFEKLLEMVQQDEKKVGKRFFRIDKDWNEPKDLEKVGITQERVNEYKRMFVELDIPRGFYAWGDGENYMFVVSSQGLGVSGSSKSYWWSKKKPESLIESDLDDYHQNQPNPNDFVFRHIEGNWYLERDSS